MKKNYIKRRLLKRAIMSLLFLMIFFLNGFSFDVSFDQFSKRQYNLNRYIVLDSTYSFSQDFLIVIIISVAIVVCLLLILTIILSIITNKKNKKIKELNKQLSSSKEELEKLQDVANHINKEKDEFLTNMSYDIRTPINSIIGALDLAKLHPNDVGSLQFSLKSIKETTNYILKLIDDMLAISKTESTHINLDEEAFNIDGLIDECCDIVKSQVTKKEIELNVNKNVTNVNLFGSSLHIRRIILNILGNAIKFTSNHGHIDLSVDELPSNNVKKTIVRIIIQDDGIGMSEEFQKDIFKPFYKENNDNSYSSTGLGMTITKKLVDLLEGNITVQSELNVGSTFTIILPIKINYDEESDENEVDEITSLNGMKILLVEDNEFNREIAKTLLEDKNAIIEEAINGLEAFEKFQNSEMYHYDIILMDIMMPIMNGLEASKKIRALNRKDAKEIPIFAMTANAFEDDIILTKEAGMNEHFSKPLSINNMLSVLSKYVIEFNEKKNNYLNSSNIASEKYI